MFQERVGQGFDARILDVRAPVWLSGVFNDERYFMSEAATVRAGFEPASRAACEWVEACRSQVGGRPIVAVGFRHATDYASLGWTLPDSYYRDAVETLPEPLTTYAWAVFGDAREPNLATARSIFGIDAITVSAHQLGPVDQLNAMSMFETLIIPNSTFSWWAAWLAEHDHGATVIAPDPWVYFDNEIVPGRWIHIARAGGLVRPPGREPASARSAI